MEITIKDIEKRDYNRNAILAKGFLRNIDLTESIDKFIEPQLEQIETGLDNEINASLYADPEFNWEQMREIRYGLEKKLDVSIYANLNYEWRKMEEIRSGLEDKLDVSVYANEKYSWAEMEQIKHINIFRQKI